MRTIPTSSTFASILLLLAISQRADAAPAVPPAPSGRDDDPTSALSYSIDIAPDEAKAQASIGGYFVADNRSSNEETNRTDVAWKLGISVPVSGEDNVLERATLDKLGNGTKLSGQVSLLKYHFDFDKLNSAPFKRLMVAAITECARKAQEIADADEEKRCNDALPAESFILRHTPAARLAMNRSLYSGFWNLGARGSVSFDRFSFVTPVTLDEQKDREIGYSATGWVTYYPSDAVSAWKLEAEYSDAPEAADDQIVCKAVVVNPNDDCVKAAAAGPLREQALVFRGEYRRFFPFRSGNGGIGTAITGSVDALDGEYGFELPIYFSIPGQNIVAPGVKFGYASKEDDFTFALFLKSEFSF